MPRRRKKKPAVSLGVRAAVVVAVLIALVAVIWWIARGRGAGSRIAVPARHEFGVRLRELAARRNAVRIDADDPIRKIHGVFIRTWRITLPDARRVQELEEDLAAEAPRWQARLTKEMPTAYGERRLKLSHGIEAFDIRLRSAAAAESARKRKRITPGPSPRPTLPPNVRGKLAIMLDDAGLRMDVVRAAARLPKAVAVSVLPFLPHSVDAAIALHRAGHEVWLHLPMEPIGYPREDPGPGAVLVTMSESQVRFTVRSALNNVPFIAGVNNHMGSRATANLRVMTWVMQEIAARHLAFIDSRTTVKTVAEDAARAQGIRTGRRNVFLDNVQTPAAIRRQLAEAVYFARRHGRAIAIGHVHPVTIRVLAQELPHLHARGADLVPPSKLVR